MRSEHNDPNDHNNPNANMAFVKSVCSGSTDQVNKAFINPCDLASNSHKSSSPMQSASNQNLNASSFFKNILDSGKSGKQGNALLNVLNKKTRDALDAPVH